MVNVLEYASPANPGRWSRLSMAAFGAGVLGLPALFLSFHLFQFLPGETLVQLLIALFLLLPLSGFVTAIAALSRIHNSKGRLRGSRFGWVGMLVSVAWPMGLLFWIVAHWPRC